MCSGLDEGFERHGLGFGPYVFPALAATTDAEAQAAIGGGLFQATRIDWVGERR